MLDGASVRCWLFTTGGQLLSAGTAALPRPAPEPDAIIAFWADKPSRVIQQCLLGRLEDVRLQTDDGTLFRARVEHVFFQPPHGRCCRLRVLGVACPSTAVAPVDLPAPDAAPGSVPAVAILA